MQATGSLRQKTLTAFRFQHLLKAPYPLTSFSFSPRNPRFGVRRTSDQAHGVGAEVPLGRNGVVRGLTIRRDRAERSF